MQKAERDAIHSIGRRSRNHYELNAKVDIPGHTAPPKA
jgi:hypothetical protein